MDILLAHIILEEVRKFYSEIIRESGYKVAQSMTPEMPGDEVVCVTSSKVDHDARMDSYQNSDRFAVGIKTFMEEQSNLDVMHYLTQGLTYREIISIKVKRNSLVNLVAISLLFGAATIPMLFGAELYSPVNFRTWGGTGLYYMENYLQPVVQMPLQGVTDMVSHIVGWEMHVIITDSITWSNYFSLVLIFGLISSTSTSERQRKSPEEIIKAIFSNASITPKSINRIAEESELQWNTAEKYIKLIELIQSLPLRIVKTEKGPTYVSRLPAEELTFDQKIAIYKLVYSPKLTESEQILISLLSKPEGEILKETPEIKHLVKIGRIKKEGNKFLLTGDGEIIAIGLQTMFSEEIR